MIVLMGSGAETAESTAKFLAEQGEKVGVVKVRLYRPFAIDAFVNVLPPTVKAIAALDRTKEPGASGEPMYLDIISAVVEAVAEGKAPFATMPRIIGGRYGLSSKEFTPGMVKSVFDELAKPSPKNHFTVGINDDVSHTSLTWDKAFGIESSDVVRAVFYGLGSDGTVGANKNSIKIIGEDTPNHAQAYFVYDSKKAGSVTVSHLRFGKEPIHAPYLIESASFVGVHQFNFLERYDVLRLAAPGATFLLNSPYGPEEVWDKMPRSTQQAIIDKNLKFYVVDGYQVAKETKMGRRINTIMQTCFFALSGVLPTDEAIAAIKTAIKKTYGKRVEQLVVFYLVQRNSGAVYLRQIEEELPVFPLWLAQWRLRLHVDRFELWLTFVLHRANFNAEAATSAIFRCHLEGKRLAFKLFVAGVGGFEGSGRIC